MCFSKRAKVDCALFPVPKQMSPYFGNVAFEVCLADAPIPTAHPCALKMHVEWCSTKTQNGGCV